jgi:hypothetical protein
MKELLLHGVEGAAVVSGGELAMALGVEVRVGGLCGGFVTDGGRVQGVVGDQ